MIVCATFRLWSCASFRPNIFTEKKPRKNAGDDDDDGDGNGDWRLFRPQLHLSEMIEERQKITPAVGASQWTLITSEKQTFNYCV